MIRIYKYLVVSALFALLCSCEADYKPNDLFGNWHENTGDSISLSLNEDMTFIEVIKPHVSRTINRNSDSTMVLTGKWSIEKPLSPECCWNLTLEYQTHNSTGQVINEEHQLSIDGLHLMNHNFKIFILDWDWGRDDGYALERQ